jgi:hypothetical protein
MLRKEREREREKERERERERENCALGKNRSLEAVADGHWPELSI